MGMHVFNAYLYKDNATFADIDECIKDLVKIKEKFYPYVLEGLKHKKFFTDPKYLNEEYFSKGYEGMHQFIDEVRKDTKSYQDGMDFDFSFNVMVYMHDNKIVLQVFASRNLDDFVKENFPWENWSFYDYYEDDDNFTDERAKFLRKVGTYFEDLFKPSGIPSNVGLCFNICDSESDIILNLGWDLQKYFSKEFKE